MGETQGAATHAAPAATPSEATLSSQPLDIEKQEFTHSSESSSEIADADNGEPRIPSEEDPSPETSNDDHKKYQKNIVIIVLSLCMCVFLAALDQTIITTAIPVIAGEFNSPSAYTWIGSSYMLASAAFLPSWGKFSDIWGRKPVLLAAAVLFLIGSVLCAAANGIGLLLVGRTIQGLGAGGQLGLVNVTISDIVTVRQRGMYLSYLGMTWALASAIGPVLGGVFTGMADWGWRFCFIINIPVGIVAMAGIWIFLHLHSPTIGLWEGLKRVDWLGTLFIVAGVVLFLIGLEFGGVKYAWDSATVLCLIIIGVFLLACFIVVEWKFAILPLMPLRLFAHRTRIAGYLVAFWHGFVFIAGCYFLPLYFQAVRGDSPLLSGVYVLPFVVFLSLASGAIGVIISRTGRYQELIWGGCALMSLGYGLFTRFNRTSGWAELVLVQTIAGIGAGPLFQSPLIAVHSVIDAKDIATATSTFAFIRTLGTALAISLGLTVFQNGMAAQKEKLSGLLPPHIAELLTGQSASASIEIVNDLPTAQRNIARDAYAVGMRNLWWFILAICIVCMICSLPIGRHHLSKQIHSTQPIKKRITSKERKAATEKANGDANV